LSSISLTECLYLVVMARLCCCDVPRALLDRCPVPISDSQFIRVSSRCWERWAESWGSNRADHCEYYCRETMLMNKFKRLTPRLTYSLARLFPITAWNKLAIICCEASRNFACPRTHHLKSYEYAIDNHSPTTTDVDNW